MDNDQTQDTADARSDLAAWLDDYTAGRCDRARMQASFLEICRSNPEAPWDALALLDQYQRKGRVDAPLARSLKSDIAQLVFGVVNQTEEDVTEDETPPPPSDPDTTSDTTGTRWRRMAADRASVPRAEPAFMDPIQFSRDLDPQTRPPPPVKPQPAREPRVQEATRIAPGSVLRDRYELLEVLGRGSTGSVYRALDRHRAHLDATARCVALRVFKLNYRDSPHALHELERQFHQAQSLAHPNVVSVFDLDRDGGTYFMVMELLEGELLSDVLERLGRRPMARDRALSVIGSIGAALAHAHRRGVVHGDLKPGNVMVSANGEVKVLDFGFVRREHADPGRMEPWIGDPAAGFAHGSTLAYASEERVNGEPLDDSMDVYSLACIAYELLTAEHPFGGRSAPLARAQGRPPQRVRGLNGRQWSALQTALQWSKADRKIDVVGLIAGLGCADVRQQLTPPQQMVSVEGSRGWSSFGKAVAVIVVLLAAAAIYWRGPWPKPEFMVQDPVEPVAPSPAAAAPQVADAIPSPEPEVATTQPSEPASTQPVQTATPPPLAAASAPRADQTPEPATAAPVATPSAARGLSRISFDKDTYVTTENEGAAKLTVKRTGNLRSAASFSWTLIPNSAAAGDDFAAIGPGAERFASGSNSATITIPLVSDGLKEPTELFLVEISADEGTERGELTRAAVIVVDDD